MKLLVQGSAILAKEPMLQTDEYIRTYIADGKADAEYPLHTMPGWKIVDVPVPDGFVCASYTYDAATNSVAQKPPVIDKVAHNAAIDAQIVALEAKCVRPMRDILAATLSDATPEPTDVQTFTNLKTQIDQLRTQRIK